MMTNRISTSIKVAVSGAAGNIGYALLPLLASGYVFQNRPVELRLLEIPSAMKSLRGTRMELLDCAFPTLVDVLCTDDPLVAFRDADVIVLVGGFPRKSGMARRDLIRANAPIFAAAGRAIEEAASPDARVLVVANPANTNCLIALEEAGSRVPSKNFCALSFLDHQRARGRVARRLGVPADRVGNVTVWGNHSETQYPDALTDGYCLNGDGQTRVPLKSLLADDLDWVTGDFVSEVQKRGVAVIEARGSSSAMSAAVGTADCLRTWLVSGTTEGETVSMAVYNDKGYYGVKKGIVYSFPCECRNGDWSVKEGLDLSDFARTKLRETEKELLEEREAARELVENAMKRSLSAASTSTSLTVSESDASVSTSLETNPLRLMSRI